MTCDTTANFSLISFGFLFLILDFSFDSVHYFLGACGLYFHFVSAEQPLPTPTAMPARHVLASLLSPLSAAALVNITFPTKPPSVALLNVVEDNFIGISWELSSFDTLCEYPKNRFESI